MTSAFYSKKVPNMKSKWKHSLWHVGIGNETKTPQKVLQLISKVKKLPFRCQVTY